MLRCQEHAYAVLATVLLSAFQASLRAPAQLVLPFAFVQHPLSSSQELTATTIYLHNPELGNGHRYVDHERYISSSVQHAAGGGR